MRFPTRKEGVNGPDEMRVGHHVSIPRIILTAECITPHTSVERINDACAEITTPWCGTGSIVHRLKYYLHVESRDGTSQQG